MKFEFVAADTFPTADTVLAVPRLRGRPWIGRRGAR